ncbi:cell wall integrity and stress response component 4-like isoform X2 [Salvelinus namaycush]|uniref:Cell wall integrity and stress response component 4-like isoform X2 n=1 Tax=Salvelinus namaycush TaxID=8040 RepID=A0A8U0P5W9_SALNM|nr:cell wall integrity and stress response component 4-like isoform X2 [Salvelinus namaycush]
MPAICDLCIHPPLKREQPGRTLTGGNTPKLTHTQAQPQAQVQAGKRLHVYLEETRVSQSGTYTHTKQEVLLTTNTRVKKSISRAKSSESADLSAKNTSTEERTEQRKVRTCLKAAIGVKCHSNYSALLGVSLKLHTKTLRAIADTASDTDTVTDRDTDTMGRKNSARRRSRKSSFEDGGGASSRENTPTKTQPAPEISSTSSDNNTPTPGDSTPSSSKDKHASVISTATGKQGSTTSSGVPTETHPRKGVEEAQEALDAPVYAILAAEEGDMDVHMLNNTSPCQLERRTESAESKRRSMKIT